MNVPIDTLAFAKSFEDVGFGHDQAHVLAVAFGQTQAAVREDLVTKDYLDARLAEVKQAIAESAKEVTGRLWSTVAIIAGVSTAISATIGAGVALLLHAKGI